MCGYNLYKTMSIRRYYFIYIDVLIYKYVDMFKIENIYF